MIKPSRLFYFGSFVILAEGVILGFMLENILFGLILGFGGLALFIFLDLFNIHISKRYYSQNDKEVQP